MAKVPGGVGSMQYLGEGTRAAAKASRDAGQAPGKEGGHPGEGRREDPGVGMRDEDLRRPKKDPPRHGRT